MENQQVVEEFNNAINTNGAILFAVCRGKMSEGIDFADDAARAVVVIGVPFPCMTDKRVTLKREYLDCRSQSLQINGKTWYTQEAIKAVNQSIGRVIRHANDYGAIVLVDQRYSSDWLKSYLSKWLRNQIEVVESCENCIELLDEFFDKMHKESVNYKAPARTQGKALKPKPVKGKEVKNVSNKNVGNKKKRKRKDLEEATTKTTEETKDTSCSTKSIETKKEPSKESKEKHMKSLYDIMLQTLGNKKLKALLRTIQSYKETKENKNLLDLAKEVHALFKDNSKLDDASVEQANDVLRKTVYFMAKGERESYKQYIATIIAEDSHNCK
eukprot:TRINITY_DN2521_c0_g2_i3.p1 TRINITY_DN2521_c0_g2~~TRINITY_DN2521_c0_g2_i3.p1  ORF type:complete len:328 (+),score=75.57 TRINITY_DN2521_c0_g2_i3:168-1151(+)